MGDRPPELLGEVVVLVYLFLDANKNEYIDQKDDIERRKRGGAKGRLYLWLFDAILLEIFEHEINRI